MAFLIDIGTGIVGKLVELTFAPIGRQVGYLIYYNRNVKSLEDQLNDLVAASQSVEQRVAEEKRNIREVEIPINKWLIDVEKITVEANDILNDQHKVKKKWVCALCPNLVVRHQLSRRSTKLVSEIAELYGKKEFNTFAHATTPQDVPTKDYEAFESRIALVVKIMDVLRDGHDIDMIGVYGFGGVGKTTLVKEVARQASGDKALFDDVALILDVKQNPNIQEIQKGIAEKLGLDLPENETIAGRARRLSSRIKDQKTLVILDDVWERIDLEKVGISGVPACKVLLTSRSRDVLSGQMHTQREFPIDLLGEEETWRLFEKKAGDVVKDHAIRAVATKVAKRCGGLPVLVVTVASALKNRSSLSAWKDALRRLKRCDNEEFKEKTYLALEWSYSQLNDEELKPLFLLCGFYATDLKTILIQDLLKYGFGLGLFKNLSTLGEAWDALNTRLEKLKDSCLLLDHEDSGCVKMHDLVHDVAKRISSRDQHVLKVSDADEFKAWPDNKDFCEKCTMISLDGLSSVPKLPEVLQCKELKAFVLTIAFADYSLEIPDNFFKETTKLGVLDLTGLEIPSLPSSLQFLKSLKTLCLDGCRLENIALIGQLQDLEMLSFLQSELNELPKEIAQLTHLRSLDLTGCSKLELISPNVISNLKKLEELRMGMSFNQWEVEGANNIENKNASLSELTHLSELSVLHIHILDAKILPTNLFSDSLERFQIYIGAEWDWDGADANLNTLKIKLTTSSDLYQSGVNMLLKRTDELHLNGTDANNNSANQLDGEAFQQLKHLHVHNAEFRHIINGKSVSPNLKRLVVSGLDGSRFLLSSSVARSLVQLRHLEISGCAKMEGIVSTNESDEKHMKDMFSKLQHLRLTNLPILTSFCSKIYFGIPSLEILPLENDKEIEEREAREIHGNALFDEKVLFSSLKKLSVKRLAKLITIWHNQLSPESFKNLERLKIRYCQNLKSVFPTSMVRSLQQLMKLEVYNCDEVEEIVANEDGVQTIHEFVFSKVNYVYFGKLPHLSCFYPGMHASWWPSLEVLKIIRCGKVAFLAQEYSSFKRTYELMNPTPNQALFLIWKDSFPNLKTLYIIGMEIWDGPFHAEFFNKLEELDVRNQPSKSAAIGGEIESAPSNEISLYRKSSRSGDINAGGALPHLSVLRLDGMSKLTHLGEDSFQTAGQDLPNLTELWIHNCGCLRNLRSSALSFKNLIQLWVYGCLEMEYLVTYSTAKSLTQLTDLSVENCARLVEIVGSTADDQGSGNEIVFSRLESLELSKLPKLQGFCCRESTVKFPSLKTLCISKRLKLKIFGNDETLQVTSELNDTDVDADEGEKAAQVSEENVDINASDVGEQIDETTTIKNEKDDKKYDESVTKENADYIRKGEKEKVDIDISDRGGNGETTNVTIDANFDGAEHVQPLETTTASTDQGAITPVEVNLAIVPVGEVTTPVIPVTSIEPPPVNEVPYTEESQEQAFLTPKLDETRLNVHQTPNAPEQHAKEQSGPFEHSAAATETPTLITPALPSSSSLKSSGAKGSLREKLQVLSAKKAASTSGLPDEAKTKLKAVIATADLKDPQTRQQLLAVLPTLQLSTTKWIADLAVQEISKLPLVLDKEISLCQELAALKAQGSELDERSHILLSEGSLAEESIHKFEEQKVELFALEEKIKKLEAEATSLRAEIATGEKRYSGFEASLDQLFEEQQLNQLSVDSTSQELLRTRAVSDSLCTAIFTHLRQLL